MAQACASCNGVGYGTIDPEFGWRKGGPCPDCTNSLEKRKDDHGGLGPAPKGSKPAPTKTVDFVDSEPHDSGDEFPVDVVNTGTEVVTIAEGVELAAGEGAGESGEE